MKKTAIMLAVILIVCLGVFNNSTKTPAFPIYNEYSGISFYYAINDDTGNVIVEDWMQGWNGRYEIEERLGNDGYRVGNCNFDFHSGEVATDDEEVMSYVPFMIWAWIEKFSDDPNVSQAEVFTLDMAARYFYNHIGR